nr:VP7 protein [Equine encephalosis virus]
MDAIAARALSVVRACVTAQDPRATMAPQVLEILGLGINRYNAITGSRVTMRPGTVPERNDMMFMCIDMVCAALNIQLGNVSPDYTQKLETIGVLATSEIPYTDEAINAIVRVTGETQTWGPVDSPMPPYLGAVAVEAPGHYFMPLGRQTHSAYTDSNTIQVSLTPNSAAQVNGAMTPQGVELVQLFFVWRPFAMYTSQAGAAVAQPPGVTLSLGGVNMPEGRILIWDGVAPVVVQNPGNAPAMAQIEVVRFTQLLHSYETVPETRENMARCYSFLSVTWHTLRSAILRSLGMLPVHQSAYPPTSRYEYLAYLLIAALADAYDALRPNFDMFNQPNVPLQPTRAQIAALYR